MTARNWLTFCDAADTVIVTMADEGCSVEVTAVTDASGGAGGQDPAVSRSLQSRSSVTDLIRRLDAAAEPETPDVSSNKRGRSESKSPAQRDVKARDTRDDWSKFEVILDAALSKLRQQIQADFEIFRTSMKAEFNTIGERLKRAEQQLEQKEKELVAITNRAQATESELTALRERVEENERVSRLPSLVLSGAALPPRPTANEMPERGENVDQLVVDTLRRNFRGLNVSVNDIERAHRLPSKGDPKIICRFVRSGAGSVREEVYQRRLELKGRSLYVNECLTRGRAEIMTILLNAKHAGKVYTVFSRNGHVFYKDKDKGRNVRVDSVVQALSQFVEE